MQKSCTHAVVLEEISEQNSEEEREEYKKRKKINNQSDFYSSPLTLSKRTNKLKITYLSLNIATTEIEYAFYFYDCMRSIYRWNNTLESKVMYNP